MDVKFMQMTTQGSHYDKAGRLAQQWSNTRVELFKASDVISDNNCLPMAIILQLRVEVEPDYNRPLPQTPFNCSTTKTVSSLY